MKLSSLLYLLPLSKAKVIEVTDADIGTYLNRGIPTILDLYASWCGHCKTFSPVFDDLAAEYEHLSDQIQFIKVDGDINRKTATKFDVQYFPTIKFIDAEDNIEEINSRDIKSMRKLIKDRVGITSSSPATVQKNADSEEKPSDEPVPKIHREEADVEILSLIDDNFEENILGKNAFVSFTTEWCGYCRSMADDWAKLAYIYSRDDELSIANVDCSSMELSYSLTEVFNIQGFPTIMYFSADPSVEPEMYSGTRNLESFVEFLKTKGITHRDVSGKLTETAGLISDLDLAVLPDYQALIEQVKTKESKYVSDYTRILEKASADVGYLEKEAKRLGEVIKSALSPTDMDRFTTRLNIVKSLIKKDDVKEEL